MNAEKLAALLSQEEGIALEFKESLDLDSREGKGKFLKDLLALVNSPANQSFLIVGIEDKTKKPVGFAGITEEKLQQIVSNYCRPPIDLEFHTVDYQGVPVGIIQIFHRYKFHTLKESYKYQSNGKDVVIREKAVFIRRGSMVDEATPDEVVDMAQSESTDLTAIASGLDKINGWLEEIAYNGSRPHFEPIEHSREFTEPSFISMICAMLLAGLWLFTSSFPVDLAALPISVVVTLTAATIRVVDFGVRRIITVSFVVGFVLTLWFRLGITLVPSIVQWMVDAPMMGILLNGLAGAVLGFLVSILLEIWHPFGG